ncbi:hypothetical protein [Paenibacillus etheri]|nr:hypothetical protein [Paenibacillus etheri]
MMNISKRIVRKWGIGLMYTAYAAGFPEYTFSFKELLPEGGSPFAAVK